GPAAPSQLCGSWWRRQRRRRPSGWLAAWPTPSAPSASTNLLAACRRRRVSRAVAGQLSRGALSRTADDLRNDLRVWLGLARVVRPGRDDGSRPACPLADEQVEVREEPAGELELGQPLRERAAASAVLLTNRQALDAARLRPCLRGGQRRPQVGRGAVL